jgi:hypothetical protein
MPEVESKTKSKPTPSREDREELTTFKYRHLCDWVRHNNRYQWRQYQYGCDVGKNTHNYKTIKPILKDAPDDGRVEPIKPLYLKYPQRCYWKSNTELDSNGNVKETIYAWYQKRLGYKGGWEPADFEGTYDLPGSIYKPDIDPTTIQRGYIGFWKEPSTPCEEKGCKKATKTLTYGSNADKHPDVMDGDVTGSDTDPLTSADELADVPSKQKTKEGYLKNSFVEDSEEEEEEEEEEPEESDETSSGSEEKEEKGRLKIPYGVISNLTSMHKQTLRYEPEVEQKARLRLRDRKKITISVYHRVPGVQNPLQVQIEPELSVHILKFYISQKIGEVQKQPVPNDLRLCNDFENFGNSRKCKELVGKKVELVTRLRGGAEPKLNLSNAFELVHRAMDLPTSVLQQEVHNTFPNFAASCQSKIKEFQVKRPSLKSLEKSMTVTEANLLKVRQQIQASLQELYELCVVSAAKAAYLNSKKMESLHKKQHQQAKVELKLHQQQQLQQLQHLQQQQLQQPCFIQQQQQEQQQCVVEEVNDDSEDSN